MRVRKEQVVFTKRRRAVGWAGIPLQLLLAPQREGVPHMSANPTLDLFKRVWARCEAEGGKCHCKERGTEWPDVTACSEKCEREWGKSSDGP